MRASAPGSHGKLTLHLPSQAQDSKPTLKHPPKQRLRLLQGAWVLAADLGCHARPCLCAECAAMAHCWRMAMITLPSLRLPALAGLWPLGMTSSHQSYCADGPHADAGEDMAHTSLQPPSAGTA